MTNDVSEKRHAKAGLKLVMSGDPQAQTAGNELIGQVAERSPEAIERLRREIAADKPGRRD
jgi:hypothetical protein